jgi:hypothetical protein
MGRGQGGGRATHRALGDGYGHPLFFLFFFFFFLFFFFFKKKVRKKKKVRAFKYF